MRQIRYTQALNEALHEEMERDPSVMQLGEDIGPYGGVWEIHRGLLSKFGPMRVRQTPISECGFIGLAVGAAMSGLRPVVEIMYIDFITTAMDQVINQAAKLPLMSGGAVKVPLVIRGEQGSGTREAAQHSQNLESWFVHTPGLKVVMPSTPYDAKGLLKSAIRDDEPVMFLEHRLLYGEKGEVPEGEYVVPIGEGIVRREGKDLTVVSTSYFLLKVLEAAQTLEAEGIDVEVIDPRTLMPLDINLIVNSVQKTGKLLVVQEATVVASMGAEIVRQVVETAFDALQATPRVIGNAHVPMPYSPVLEDTCMPSRGDLLETIRQMAVGTRSKRIVS
ncbi:MAG: alpha-ketoacid dehydrogenase subunit beta [Armatimonadetes bacterium CG2_30_59_28]|nr:alpha-ketoacid dehydrogenase subunit beta [Armatimonadota bacterium]OIO91737.1 MAG: alpha-ketoacid dehydrogenase subunit beta [Armatimonadetes bacterium CG2_30_59_28]PIU63748.1 MAG: alpha-ketoacid dehydrogenase subunit beta [Armatimonadetes bacterium CG07_land_8_20_14_0_80_59_28]PIX41266.1 MAG: alpha-ketoacid dehydrogenase subunit beta [Armatimonadetes bacterium CG_4_8_14_3_um_filter_58_9]PIY43166.1 MAG: alpha-ketoacid dehydrogenase subunit beta [Armatimonadetes bacterium CG_4_10_14_3_um_fil